MTRTDPTPLGDVDADLLAAAPSKSQRAYEHLRGRIARHEVTPGYRLVLQTIAAELGMSVVPVREAVRRLEAEGLVTFERNVGARVAMVDEHGYVDAMQALGIVEGAATALAAPLLSPEAIDQARTINGVMRTLLHDFDPHTFTVLNQRFHTALFEVCPNRVLLDMVHRGWARLAGLRDSTFAFVPGRAEQSVAEHVYLLDLIAHGADPLEIEVTSREHRQATLRAFLQTRGDAAAPTSSRTRETR